MKLIIESGSTKTDWRFVKSSGVIESIDSMGINPTIQSSGEIRDEQDNVLRKLSGLEINQIDYYGAGCGNDVSKEKIKNVLSAYFPNVSIQIESDLIAAYKAVFGSDDGITCILGTGSNSALFENEKLIENVKSLGYLMGDEGSGAQIGKQLMQDYFRSNIPPKLDEFMKNYFGKSNDQLIKDIYRLKYPNRFFARLVKDIISENSKNSYLLDLVENQIHLFFHNCILKYKHAQEYEIGFVGSIAFYFQDIVREIASNYRLSIRNIIKRPIDELVKLEN